MKMKKTLFYVINRNIDIMTEKTLSESGTWTDNFYSDSMRFASKEEAKNYIDMNFEKNEYDLSIMEVQSPQ